MLAPINISTSAGEFSNNSSFRLKNVIIVIIYGDAKAWRQRMRTGDDESGRSNCSLASLRLRALHKYWLQYARQICGKYFAADYNERTVTVRDSGSGVVGRFSSLKELRTQVE